MPEQLSQSPEQSRSTEVPRPPEVPKSSEKFTGENINDAVKAVQNEIGVEIDEAWWNKNVGEANNDVDTAQRFDIAIKREADKRFWEANGVASEQISAIQGHEDYTSQANETALQINGINIPAEIAQSDEVDPNTWAAEEAKRREDYIFKGAEYHLGYEFTISGKTFKVDGIYYTGTDGDYTTLAIDIVEVETGAFTSEIEPSKINDMIKKGEVDTSIEPSDEESTPETSAEDTEAIKAHELQLFDERFPDSKNRKDFEQFLNELFDDRESLEDDPNNKPEDQEDYVDQLLDENVFNFDDSAPQTEDSPNPEADVVADIRAEKIREAFVHIVARHPLPEEFIDELQTARDNIDAAYEANQTDYKLAK